MNLFIMTGGEKNRYWIVNVIEPENVKIASGEMNLRVNVITFARSMEAAKVKLLEEKMKG